MPARPRSPSPSPSPRHAHAQNPPPQAQEFVQGLRSGLAVFARRRDDIVRVMCSRAARSELAEVARWAEAKAIPFVEAQEPELDRFAESHGQRGGHHEGVIVVTRPRRFAAARELADALVKTGGMAVALDRVRNPYNVGAILRSAAFFGMKGAIFGAQALHGGRPEPLPSTAVRVAEGGVEHLLLTRTTDLADTLARLRERGALIIGADGHSPTSASGFPYTGPAVLVLGHEREGLGERVRAQCDAIVSVRGAGHIESLNVAVAAGVLMAEMVNGDTNPRTSGGSGNV